MSGEFVTLLPAAPLPVGAGCRDNSVMESFPQPRPLAAYALHDALTAGRKYPEPPHPYRAPFQRDRDRIIHCSAFRRLSNKTQVFTGPTDYHRTRLTHTLEMAGLARTLGRALGLNEDLIEALALAHDLGHPPFGHAGEETLNECLAAAGGFDHNRHGLRIVEELEQRYPDFPGLNLSLEVLEGQTARIDKGSAARSASAETTQFVRPGERPPRPLVQDPGAACHGTPLVEVQVVDAADGIAYDTHDADDALEVGLLTLDELLELPLWHQAALRVRRRWSGLSPKELKRAVLHELIDWQVTDLLESTRKRLADNCVDGIEAVRRAPPVALASSEVAQQKAELEAFLYQRVYRHPQLLEIRRQAQGKLAAMFQRLVERPDLLPAGFQSRMARDGVLRTVGDYLAGMTDRFAQQQFERLLNCL